MSTADDTLQPEELADAARAAMADAQGRTAREAIQVLAQAGLTGVCALEDDGGLGLPIAFAVPIAQAAGEQHVHLPLVELLLLARHLSGTPWASSLATGEKLATVAWQGDLAEGLLGPARHAGECDWALVPEVTPAGVGAALVDLSGATVVNDPALDPEHPQQWIRLSNPTVLTRLDVVAYAALLHDAQLLLAALAQGAAQGALEATVTYLSARVQFGRPLTAKQAVRHWLSRMKLVQEVSAAAIQRVLSPNEYGHARSARSVLAGALHNSTFVIEKAIHLHGGMGFTCEVPLHHALREVRKLDAAFGSGALAREVGRSFIESV